MKVLRLIFLLSFVFVVNKGYTQTEITELTVEQIMQNPDHWVGSLPENIFWSENSEKIYFDWNPKKNPGTSLYHFSLIDYNPVKTSIREQKNLPSKRGDYSQNFKKMVYSKSGNLYLYDIKTENSELIFSNLDYINSAWFTNNDQDIAFVIDNNLYLYNIDKGTIKQVTNIKEKNNSFRKNNGAANKQWYVDQQTELFTVFEEKNRQKMFAGKQ
ncbi:MAG: DPP IV N-terminal domain-containing protein [Bacteroidales bacterium]